MIRIKKLSKSFQDQVVLEDINLEIQEGEILTIFGESGSGKTVLLKHMIGLLKPDEVTIEIDSVDISGLRELELLKIRKNMGYLFQEGALYDFMTVYENVAFPLVEHTDLGKEKIDKKVQEILKTVGLDEAADKWAFLIHELGMKPTLE